LEFKKIEAQKREDRGECKEFGTQGTRGKKVFLMVGCGTTEEAYRQGTPLVGGACTGQGCQCGTYDEAY